MEIFNTFLYNPLLWSLVTLYNALFHNFGLAILALTLLIRVALIPLSMPSLKTAKKMQDLKPHLDKLKEKHGSDKQKLAQAQMDLYKEHGVNPMAGCLPQILQIVVLIAMYNVFMNFINNGKIDGQAINMGFLWLDLAKKDPYYILPVVAGLSQLMLSLMMSPVTNTSAVAKVEDKKKEQDATESMQKQMLFMMPLMTVVISLNFPSGLALYWVATTVFSIAQQYKVYKWGGLLNLADKARGIISPYVSKHS